MFCEAMETTSSGRKLSKDTLAVMDEDHRKGSPIEGKTGVFCVQGWRR